MVTIAAFTNLILVFCVKRQDKIKDLLQVQHKEEKNHCLFTYHSKKCKTNMMTIVIFIRKYFKKRKKKKKNPKERERRKNKKYIRPRETKKS